MSFWGLLKTRCLAAEDDAREVFVDALIGDAEQVGDEFLLDGYRFKVRAMRRRRIQVLQVTREDDGEAEA